MNKTITSLFITWDVVPTNQTLELIPEFKVIYSLKFGKKDIHGSEVTDLSIELIMRIRSVEELSFEMPALDSL